MTTEDEVHCDKTSSRTGSFGWEYELGSSITRRLLVGGGCCCCGVVGGSWYALLCFAFLSFRTPAWRVSE